MNQQSVVMSRPAPSSHKQNLPIPIKAALTDGFECGHHGGGPVGSVPHHYQLGQDTRNLAQHCQDLRHAHMQRNTFLEGGLRAGEAQRRILWGLFGVDGHQGDLGHSRNWVPHLEVVISLN